MCAQQNAEASTEPRSFASRIEGPLTWLGGGHWGELAERHERSTHAVAGAVVLLGAVLASLVAGLALSEAARWPMLVVVPLALVFGLLVGAAVRGTAGGPDGSRASVAGRGAVAAAVGGVVGELAALVIFAGSIDHRLDERALAGAESSPPVAQAAAALQQAKEARGALDRAVERAREHQDQALVVARCEYHPTPTCPQTRITGVPGSGPETRTANELLADAQHELDNALATRDRQAPELDARISRGELSLTHARQDAVADSGRGLGARWVAMNELTLASPGALVLRVATIAFFALLCLLPLILRQWRGETTHDRHVTARAEQERAELEADTAIAIKRAQVRREAEIMWAEHQLTQARLAIEAQTEIDRENQRRRVLEALDPPARTSSRRAFEPAEDDIYLPIAAEAEAASLAIAPLPPAETAPENLPAHVEAPGEVEPRHEERAAPLIPSIPDATKAAARWIRPLVPPFVARVIDNTTAPLRTARQVFEEVEEIRFSLRRTHRVTFDAESTDNSGQSSHQSESSPAARIASSRPQRGPATHERYSSVRRVAAGEATTLGPAEDDRNAELVQRDGPRELRSPDGPRQLPPGK
ncbi:DUF4407 domain-containing protein [Mycobacterium terramassiliense]|uniref:Membrane protein n=1 Tax=Mycobacterium terramassiliense TaxID=1841859 RepID=A0A2U3N6D2_9MYCO|nr:DUF4407 domain-containing protein [Mycobacterium terramassiliense]SPM26964.1 membrane protein [Mycobacterium terramassiliense]